MNRRCWRCSAECADEPISNFIQENQRIYNIMIQREEESINNKKLVEEFNRRKRQENYLKQNEYFEELRRQKESRKAYQEIIILKSSIVSNKVGNLREYLKHIEECWNKEVVELWNFTFSCVSQLDAKIKSYEREKHSMKNVKEQYEYISQLFSKCLKENDDNKRIMEAKDELIQNYMKNIDENKKTIQENNIAIQQYRKELEEMRQNLRDRDRKIEIGNKEKEDMKNEFDKMMFENINKSNETHRMQLQKVENELKDVISQLQNELSTIESSSSARIKIIEEESKKQIEEKNKEISTLSNTVKIFSTEKYKLADDITKHQYRINELMDENEKLQREVGKNKDSTTSQIDLQNLQKENERLKLQISNSTQQYEALEAEWRKLKKDNESLMRQGNSFSQQSSSTTNKSQTSSSRFVDKSKGSESHMSFEEESSESRIIRKQTTISKSVEYTEEVEEEEELEEHEGAQTATSVIKVEGDADKIASFCMSLIINAFNSDAAGQMQKAANDSFELLKQLDDEPKYKELTRRVKEIDNLDVIDKNLYEELADYCRKLLKEQNS